VYLHTAPCGVIKKSQPRHRLTLHSFRHYAIQRFHAACKDPDLARRFARHKNQANTNTYLEGSRKEEVELVLEATLNEQNSIKELGVAPHYEPREHRIV
jgi:integrase